MTLQRLAVRSLVLAAACAVLTAWIPRYALGSGELAPWSLVLGLGAGLAWGTGAPLLALVGAVGVMAGAVWGGDPLRWALAQALQTLLQWWLLAALLRDRRDPEAAALDNGARIARLVLVAAPAAALLGAALGIATEGLLGEGPMSARATLTLATGRLLGDWAGVVLGSALVLCALGSPAAVWRPRQRSVALPLGLLLLVALTGVHEVARRDEGRLAARFQRSGNEVLWRTQARLAEAQGLLQTSTEAWAAATAAGQTPQPAQWQRLAQAAATRVGGPVQLGAWRAGPDGQPQPLADGAIPDAAAQRALARAWLGGGTQALPLPPLPALAPPPPTTAPSTPGTTPATTPATTPTTAPTTTPAPAPAPRPGAASAPGSADAPASTEAPVPTESQPGGSPASRAAQAGPRLLLARKLPAEAGRPAALLYLLLPLQPLMAPALREDDPNLAPCLIDLLSEATGPQDARLAGPPGCASGELGRLTRLRSERLPLADRPLKLLIGEPASADDRLFSAAWLAALPAVLGSGLLATLLLGLSGRLARIEERVRERTAALQAEIDERRQAESRLTRSEQRFRAIFDSVNLGVTLVDMQGRILAANPAFCSLMAATPEALLGRPLAEIRLPDVAEDDGTAAAVAGEAATRQRYLTLDGRVLQVAASLRTLRDATGEPWATVGALQDLTPVLRLREAERARDQAEIANRTKSEFLARLSHELRTPLNAIMGFAQMLSRGTEADGPEAGGAGPDPLRRQHGLEQIRQAGWHLLDMINDVLDLSRMEAGHLRLTLEPVSLPEVAQEALAIVEPAAVQAQVQLELSLSPLAERVQADPVRLRQVLINLLANAVQYNRRGGRVELRARPGGVGEVLIEVHDTGLGMTEEQLSQLFTPFNRLGRERAGGGAGAGLGAAEPAGGEGTGIGLVIARRLAQLMGGELEAVSSAGEGSVFSLRLPKAEGEPQRVEVSAASAPMPLGASIGSVLYIEDREQDVAVMRDLLAQRPGITLAVARTAAVGLLQAAEADLLLLDLDLPDGSGLDVLRKLRAEPRTRRLPVIVVSGDSHPARIDECFEAGATDYLTKPLDAALLLRAVDDAMHQG